MKEPPNSPKLGRRPQRPAHRVDDLAQRLAHAPDLLHAERPDLRVLAVEAELVDGRGGEVALRPLGQHRQPGDDVVPRLERRKRLAVASAAAVARAHADDASVLDEELRRRRLREDDHAERLGLLGEEAAELGDGEDQVPVVPHRRRRRDAERRAPREHVDGLARHLAVRREVGRLEPPAEELAKRRGIHHRAGEEVRARPAFPSRAPRSARRRAARARRDAPRAAGRAGSRTRARPGRRRRSRRRPRSARRADPSARPPRRGRRTGERSRSAWPRRR